MQGATLSINGPIDVPDLNAYEFSNGRKGGDEPDSLVMGPLSWIQVFTDDDYRGDVAYFYPDQQVPDLDEYGVGGDMDSFKLFDSRPSWFPPPPGTTMMQGVVQSGEGNAGMPLGGLHVTLFEASGAQPTVRGQATTDENGWFVIDSTKASTDSTFYVTADRGDGVVLVTVLGTALPAQIRVNELTTVAAAFALARFSATGVIQGEAPGLRIGALMNENLVSPTTGAASAVLQAPPNADETNSLRSTRSLANLLAACVAPVAGALNTLFALTTPPDGKTPPTDTFGAIVNIARYPANNVAGLYTQSQVVRTYAPVLTSKPDAWTIAVKVNNTGSSDHLFGGPANLAFDNRGFAWITNNVVQGTPNSCNFAVVLEPNGRPADGADGAPTSPLLGGGLLGAGFGVTIGSRGFVWFGNFGWGDDLPDKGGVSLFDPAGAPRSPSTPGGYVGGTHRVQATVADADGNIWNASYGNKQVVVFLQGDPRRTLTAPVPTGDAPFGIAIAADGSAWVTSGAGLYEYAPSSIARYKIDQEKGTLECHFSRQLGRALKGLSIDSRGNVWIPSGGDDVVYVLDSAGQQLGQFGGGGINGPWGTAVDGDDHVWVANFGQMLPGNDYSNAAISQLAGANSATRPPGVEMGAPLSPPTGYTLPSAGAPVRLSNGQPLYGVEGPGLDPCYSPLMRLTSVAIDQAGNVWALNNWKPNFDNDVSPKTGNPGGDGIVIFVGLAQPPRRSPTS